MEVESSKFQQYIQYFASSLLDYLRLDLGLEAKGERERGVKKTPNPHYTMVPAEERKVEGGSNLVAAT